VLGEVFLIVNSIDNFLNIFREVDQLNRKTLEILRFILEQDKLISVINLNLDRVSDSRKMNDIFARLEIDRSDELQEVLDLDPGVKLGELGQDLEDDDGLELGGELREGFTDFLEERVRIVGKVNNISRVFNKEEEFLDFIGAEFKDVVSEDVREQFALGLDGSLRADQVDNVLSGFFRKGGFVGGRRDTEDRKHKRAGLLTEFVSSDLLISGLEDGIVREVNVGMIVIEFGLPEHLSEVFKVI
jgi:hypothetical protein